jgi:hypothetical protein
VRCFTGRSRRARRVLGDWYVAMSAPSTGRTSCRRRTGAPRWQRPWLHAAVCLAVSFLLACSTVAKQSTQPDLRPWPEIRSDIRIESLRARIYEYSITFAAEVDLAAASIQRSADDATVRRNALVWRTRAIPEMRKACFRLEPIAALIDAWIFARQMDQLFSEGAGSGAFGPLQPRAVEVSRRLVDQVWEIGASIAVSPEAGVEFEQKVIDPWLAEHPLQDITFIRQSPIARFAEQSRARGDTLESVGTLEDLAVGLSQQARIYLADLPRQVQAELELLRSDILPAEIVASIQGDLRVSAAAVDRIASTAEAMPNLAVEERRVVLDELNRQRALVMDAVAVERERAVGAIVRAFAAERGEMLRNFESQRRATLEWATAERREAMAELRHDLGGSIESLRRERAIVVDHVRQMVDTVLLRVAIFLLAAVVLAPLVAHAYVRVWPRRQPEPQPWQP